MTRDVVIDRFHAERLPRPVCSSVRPSGRVIRCASLNEFGRIGVVEHGVEFRILSRVQPTAFRIGLFPGFLAASVLTHGTEF